MTISCKDYHINSISFSPGPDLSPVIFIQQCVAMGKYHPFLTLCHAMHCMKGSSFLQHNARICWMLKFGVAEPVKKNSTRVAQTLCRVVRFFRCPGQLLPVPAPQWRQLGLSDLTLVELLIIPRYSVAFISFLMMRKNELFSHSLTKQLKIKRKAIRI